MNKKNPQRPQTETKQDAFVDRYIMGMQGCIKDGLDTTGLAYKAYMEIYGVPEASAKAASSKILAYPEVQKKVNRMLKKIETKIVNKAAYDLNKLIAEWVELKDDAKTDDEKRIVATSLTEIGKLLGFYVQKVENTDVTLADVIRDAPLRKIEGGKK